jgi:hypothetical protein
LNALLPNDLLLQTSVRVENIDRQRHGSIGVSCATETWVKRANHAFHPVEHALGHILARQVFVGDLLETAIHGQRVVRGGDNEVCAGHHAVVIDFVVVDQSAARRFNNADAFGFIGLGFGANVRIQNVWIQQNLLHPLDGEDHLNQPRVVIVE